MKFRGFGGEKVEVTKGKDTNAEHDHLIITINGERAGYFHIDRYGLDFFHPLGSTPKTPFWLRDMRH